jgi:tRNA (cmo5U34)-methyltransferase
MAAKTRATHAAKKPGKTTGNIATHLAGNPDRIFAEPAKSPSDFQFNAKTAAVFDDMVSRSVPFYDEIQRMVTEIAADFAEPGTNLYDLGCSTATSLLMLDPLVDPSVRFCGIDCAADMLDKARTKIAASGTKRPIDLRVADLHNEQIVENASVVLMVLTLQFMRPLYRERVIRRIADGTNPQGAIILVEKLTVSESRLNRLYIKHYYDYKRRQGYSDMEISQKREALENILIPYRIEENRQLLLDSGFKHVEIFFQWYNFCGMIGVK